MKVKKCPKCRSINLEFVTGILNDEVKCNDCKYQGMVILEEDDGK